MYFIDIPFPLIKKTVIMDYTLQVVRVSTVRLFRIKLNKLIPNNLFYKEQFLEFTCITGYDRYSRKFNIMKNRSESFFFFFFFLFFFGLKPELFKIMLH